jgi:hypothetical protein
MPERLEFQKKRKHEREKVAMAKRPPIDLMALTSEHALSMPEATQRTAPASPPPSPTPIPHAKVKTENLEALAFKVPPAFRRRFRQRAATADLKLNELLFAALDAWEEKHGLKS